MPLPVIADTIRVSVEGHCANGHKFANVLHFRKPSATSYSTAIATLDPLILNHYTVAAGGGAAWKAYAIPAAGLELFRYTPLDGTTATTVVSHNVAGVGGGESLPASVCMVVTLRTGARGRSYRGRVYQGPFFEAANGANGVPAPADLTLVAAQWTAFLGTLLTNSLPLAVASYKLGVSTQVGSVSIDARWDTQRRRNNT